MSSYARITLQVLAVILAMAAALWALHQLSSLVLLLVVAVIFAYVIAPLVDGAQRLVSIGGKRRLARGPAILVVYVLLAGAASITAALVLPSAASQIDDLVERAPVYAQSVSNWERGWSRYYGRLRIPADLRAGIDQSIASTERAAADSVRGTVVALAGVLSNLPWLALVPILAFFLLKDAADLRRTAVLAVPHAMRLRFHRFFEELNTTLAAYIRAQLLACVLVGSVCGLGLALLGVSYPVVLGVLAGALEFIPLVGPLLLAVVAAVIAALHSPMSAAWTLLFLGTLRMIEDYVVYPRLIRRGIKLEPLAVIVAVLAGAELDGVVGMFLAIPAVAIASVAYRHILEWRSHEAELEHEKEEARSS